MRYILLGFIISTTAVSVTCKTPGRIVTVVFVMYTNKSFVGVHNKDNYSAGSFTSYRNGRGRYNKPE